MCSEWLLRNKIHPFCPHCSADGKKVGRHKKGTRPKILSYWRFIQQKVSAGRVHHQIKQLKWGMAYKGFFKYWSSLRIIMAAFPFWVIQLQNILCTLLHNVMWINRLKKSSRICWPSTHNENIRLLLHHKEHYHSNILYWGYTARDLLQCTIFAIIQTVDHVASAKCIKSWRYRVSVHAHIHHQNEDKCDVSYYDHGRVGVWHAGLSIL